MSTAAPVMPWETRLIMDAAIPFEMGSIYLKVSVEAEVHALVDQVRQSETRSVQYSISRQGHALWRGGRNGMPERIKAATLTDALPRTTTPAEATTMRPARCAAVKAPSSALAWCDRIAPSILSQVAAAEGVFVRFPASRYMYPLGYLLPADFHAGAILPLTCNRCITEAPQTRGVGQAQMKPTNNSYARASPRARELKVQLILEALPLQVGQNVFGVQCKVVSNTSGKLLRGVCISLAPVLRFEIDEAWRTTRDVLFEGNLIHTVASGIPGTISGRTQVLAVRDNPVAAMRSSGLEVRAVTRAEPGAAYVGRAFSEFEEVELIGRVLVGSAPPVGELTLAALPCGRTNKRDMHHAMRATSLEPPAMAALDAPLSCHGFRTALRRASQTRCSEPAS
ncbi:hypothetical protein CGC20_3595 [Leishmania donovani]|uniref:Uncharacterized protein n=1 Tax=Leishmania donovani TaxID=5661 RepID=A0A504X394_LEIDO|nr:hypothetical protein CGC20_3595 [Leishmania donovani]